MVEWEGKVCYSGHRLGHMSIKEKKRKSIIRTMPAGVLSSQP